MKLLETSGKSESQRYLAGPLPYSEDTDVLTELTQAIPLCERGIRRGMQKWETGEPMARSRVEG